MLWTLGWEHSWLALRGAEGVRIGITVPVLGLGAAGRVQILGRDSGRKLCAFPFSPPLFLRLRGPRPSLQPVLLAQNPHFCAPQVSLWVGRALLSTAPVGWGHLSTEMQADSLQRERSSNHEVCDLWTWGALGGSSSWDADLGAF